jgi:hypothetical protein
VDQAPAADPGDAPGAGMRAAPRAVPAVKSPDRYAWAGRLVQHAPDPAATATVRALHAS